MAVKGRPRAVINWRRADSLAQAGCNGEQIAASFGICADTFYRAVKATHKVTFAAWLQEKRAKGDSLIREKQFELAVKKKDKTMLIWLGKQRLNQSEKSEVHQKEEISFTPLTAEEMAKLKSQFDDEC